MWVTSATSHLWPRAGAVDRREEAKAALCGHAPGKTPRPAPDVTGCQGSSPRLAGATVRVQV